MMFQCRFLLGKNRAVLVCDVDNGGSYECEGVGGIREIFVPFFQFCHKPKTALKSL